MTQLPAARGCTSGGTQAELSQAAFDQGRKSSEVQVQVEARLQRRVTVAGPGDTAHPECGTTGPGGGCLGTVTQDRHSGCGSGPVWAAGDPIRHSDYIPRPGAGQYFGPSVETEGPSIPWPSLRFFKKSITVIPKVCTF